MEIICIYQTLLSVLFRLFNLLDIFSLIIIDILSNLPTIMHSTGAVLCE